MSNSTRDEKIAEIVTRIERSPLSAEEYIQRNEVPFSRAQFYRYRARLGSKDKDGLYDKRREGNHRKLNKEHLAFIRGYIKSKPEVGPTHVMNAVHEEFGITVRRSRMSQILKKMDFTVQRGCKEVKKEHVSCAGFEIIAALALHLGWAEHTAKCVKEVVDHKLAERQPAGRPEKRGRDAQGRFTGQYNKREKIRKMRFASIDQKRGKKNLKRMNICKRSEENLQRQNLAVLALPLVTLNGQMRNVNTALGNALQGFCGYNYKQSTLEQFLRELKYLGVSEHLLCGQIPFWQKQWARNGEQLDFPFLCYYIDGNTKPVWSKKRVKKNKVTMLGRLMGCLEQVFVHDCFGHPIYFETYSGHGPVGVYTLELMEKVERYMQEESDDIQVNRVLVMDAANNSVATLRAFASQKRYHYITLLDPNGWSERKVRHHGVPERYRWGNATLYDSEIELKDSLDEDYLITVRAIRIEWDHGKRTVLLTSLPADTVGASLVVKAYFDRWPQQELVFRGMKGFASLHRVAGYGKQEGLDATVRAKQKELEEKIQDLQHLLRGPLEQITQYTSALTAHITEERVIRARSHIEDGKRVQTYEDAETLKVCRRQIGSLQRRIKKSEKTRQKEFDKLYRYQAHWMRLQGKERVYKVDVELDQIITYFRVSLANLGAYFLKEFLGMGPTCFSTLMQSILLLDGEVEETKEMRTVKLKRNLKDSGIMKRLESAIEKLNNLSLRTLSGKIYHFCLL